MTVEKARVCTCPYTPPATWLSAASCGYGSGYEPGSMQEWNPDCPVHPATDVWDPIEVWDDSVAPGGYVCAVCGKPTESEPCAKHGKVKKTQVCATCRGTGIQPDRSPNPELVPCEDCTVDASCPKCGQFICDDRATCEGLR